jgi:hypothetical protein
MTSMIWYRFHDLTLVVHQDRPETGAELGRALQDLTWVRTWARTYPPVAEALAPPARRGAAYPGDGA